MFMDLSIFRRSDIFPSFIADRLASIPVDYREKYRQIENSRKTETPQLAAGVVLLLNYKQLSPGNSEYVFQLIKRSDKVSQAGDISCPGGMLHPWTDNILSYLLTRTLISSPGRHIAATTAAKDKETINLIRLFLTNALREAWEEIGLNPFNISFSGALPSYSLTILARTIFPSVCLIVKPFEFKLSAEVEKILEIPISHFFNDSNYAFLEIETQFGNTSSVSNNRFPCILLNDATGRQEILWGATFNIIMNFLRIISDDNLPFISSSRTIKKVLSKTYISRER
jgi:8-oxo-dGTP pyrophosphatase MutT (NUDIX family)